MFGSLTPRAERGATPRRARGDDGAAMVEAAIVMPLLMLLVFGIIEWGLAFLTATSTNSAARSGARTASALTLNTTYATQAVLAVQQNLSGAIPFATPLELWVYRVPPPLNAGSPTPNELKGFPEGQTSWVCGTNCIKYTWDGNSFVYASGAWPLAQMHVCNVAIDQFDGVGVYLKVRHNFVTNFFGSSKVIAEHTVMRLEPQPADACAAAS